MNKPEGNVFAPETLIDPFDYYRAIHEAGIAIEHLEGMNTWVVYSYDLCSEGGGQAGSVLERLHRADGARSGRGYPGDPCRGLA